MTGLAAAATAGAAIAFLWGTPRARAARQVLQGRPVAYRVSVAGALIVDSPFTSVVECRIRGPLS